jgi:hypothetical protein
VLLFGPGATDEHIQTGTVAGELRNVVYRDKPRSFRLEADRPVRGIELVVPGATIVIADIYDRPLPLIYDRIVSYWRGRDANAP